MLAELPPQSILRPVFWGQRRILVQMQLWVGMTSTRTPALRSAAVGLHLGEMFVSWLDARTAHSMTVWLSDGTSQSRVREYYSWRAMAYPMLT